MQVVPLGADHVFFRPGVDTTAVRERYGLGEGRWLLSVARLSRHKGIDTALRALACLRDQYPDLRYAVVGSGEELPAAGGRGPAARRGATGCASSPKCPTATCPRSTTSPRSTSACRG